LDAEVAEVEAVEKRFAQLEAAYFFEPPADGVMPRRRVRAFFQVMDAMAVPRNRGRQTEPTDDDAREQLAAALEQVEMSPSELVWLGNALFEAWRKRTRGASTAVPVENLRLV